MRAFAILSVTVALLSGCASGELAAPTMPYRASGNEPFWSVTVNDGRILVERPGEPKREIALAASQPTPNGYRYEGNGIAIDITRQRCEDSMSGAPFADRATVMLDGRKLEGCGGKRLPPARLEGTQWIVTTLDSETVTLTPPPTLAIDEQGRVSGSDGCNRFVGGLAFEASGAVKADGRGASTMMACPEAQAKVSAAYNALRSKVTSWRFADDALLLSTANRKSIRLRQAF